MSGIQYLGRMVVLVNDFDEAINFYTRKLGFHVLVDIQAGDYRDVHIGLPGASGIGFWFVRARTEQQRARVGNQTGGEPLAVLYTEDCRGTYALLSGREVDFRQPPQEEPGTISAEFEDLYGNVFTLVELT